MTGESNFLMLQNTTSKEAESLLSFKFFTMHQETRRLYADGLIHNLQGLY